MDRQTKPDNSSWLAVQFIDSCVAADRCKGEEKKNKIVSVGLIREIMLIDNSNRDIHQQVIRTKVEDQSFGKVRNECVTFRISICLLPDIFFLEINFNDYKKNIVTNLNFQIEDKPFFFFFYFFL